MEEHSMMNDQKRFKIKTIFEQNHIERVKKEKKHVFSKVIHAKAIYILGSYFEQSSLLNHFQQSFFKNFNAKKQLGDIPEESLDYSMRDNIISGLTSRVSRRSLDKEEDAEKNDYEQMDILTEDKTLEKYGPMVTRNFKKTDGVTTINVRQIRGKNPPRKIEEPIVLDIDDIVKGNDTPQKNNSCQSRSKQLKAKPNSKNKNLSIYKKVRNLKLNDHNIVIIGNINSKNNIYLREGRAEELQNNSLVVNKKPRPLELSREKNLILSQNLNGRNFSIEQITKAQLRDVKRNQTFKKLDSLCEIPPKEPEKRKKKEEKKGLPLGKNSKGLKAKKGGFFYREEAFKTRNSVLTLRQKETEMSKSKELFFKKFFEK